MAIQQGVWGIDLGQCGLKAIRLQEIEGEIVATAFDYVEHPKILSQPDADPDQLTREALDKFLSRNNLRGDMVAISVPGQSGLARFVKLPPVEEKKIADIVRFEAKQQIPFNLDEVVWDYQKIGSGVVTDGFAMETEIGLFAMKRDMVNRYLQHFKDVGVDVHLVQMAPLALCNYVGYDLLGKGTEEGGEPNEDKKCIVALDIGADSSNLVITDGSRIIWQRPIPLGGNHFTRALTKDLKLTFAKAEHTKRNATKSPDLKKILAALKPVLNDFVGEVQRSLGYFTNTHRDAHIEYVMGLGNAFRLPGLQKFLAEKLQLEVRKLAKMERIDGEHVLAQQVFTENVLTFAVAYGLALQGLKRSHLQTNLLPQEIRTERLVKAKKPMAVAAAAALLLACGGLALSYNLQHRTWAAPIVINAEKAAKSAGENADKARSAFVRAKQLADEEVQAVRTIVAGQFERDNWAELYKFINTAVPQPDGRDHYLPIPSDDESPPEPIRLSNLPEEAQAKYWTGKQPDGMTGQTAYEAYLGHLYNLGKEGNANPNQLPRGAEDLIQFNIEAVNAYYCDNTGDAWSAIRASPRVTKFAKVLVRPLSQLNKPPEGAGWVVAVTGWTYHHDKEAFIRNTLLENIAALGIRNENKEATDSGGGVPPPPTPKGGAKPPPPPGGAQAEDTEDYGPVVNHISHVVLYDYANSAPNGPFELIDKAPELARTLASGKGSSGGGAAPPVLGGAGNATGGQAEQKPAGPSRDSWQPLSPQDAGGRGTSGGLRNPLGGGGKNPMLNRPGGGGLPPPMNRGGKLMPPGMGGGAPMQGATGGEAGNENKRTEFVILFFWKEPTDSDSLRGLTGEQKRSPLRSRRSRGGEVGGGGGGGGRSGGGGGGKGRQRRGN